MHLPSPIFGNYFTRIARITQLCLAVFLPTSVALSLPANATGKEPPVVGDIAKDFTLKNLDGKSNNLADSLKSGPVVVVVLRGFPGYQCPLCTKQVAELIASAKKFSEASTQVLLIYPGAGKNLSTKGKEFMKKSKLPDGFQLLLDSDYGFTDSWNLRWDAANETAYPSTFVLDKEGKIKFAKISRSHGDRAPTSEIVDAVKKSSN